MSDGYLSIITSRPIPQLLNIFLLSLARILPALVVSPFFGAKSIPNPIKMGLGIAITLVLFPFLAIVTDGNIPTDIAFLLLLIKEVFIGAIMGLIIGLPFYAAQSAGGLIDHQRGAQSLQVMNPMTQSQSSPLGLLLGNITLVIFFSVGGALFFFNALLTSYEIVPANHYLGAQFFELTRPIWLLCMDFLNLLVKLTLQLAAPSVVTMLLSDLFLGIANRMAPQVQISFLLWSLKAFIGVGMLFVAWAFVLKQLEVETLSWFKVFNTIIESF